MSKNSKCTGVDRHQSKSIMLDPSSPSEMEKSISHLRNDADSRAGEFEPIPIKYLASLIRFPLSRVINDTLETGIFPTVLKIMKAKPIFKRKVAKATCNYLYFFQNIWKSII